MDIPWIFHGTEGSRCSTQRTGALTNQLRKAELSMMTTMRWPPLLMFVGENLESSSMYHINIYQP